MGKQDEPLGKNKIVKSDKKNSRLNQLDASEGKTEIDISDNQEKVNIEKSDKPDVPTEKGVKKNTGKKLNKTGVKRRTRLAPNTRSINTAGVGGSVTKKVKKVKPVTPKAKEANSDTEAEEDVTEEEPKTKKIKLGSKEELVKKKKNASKIEKRKIE